MRKETGIH